MALAVAAALVLAVAAVGAEGGTTIASAPVLKPGNLETGTGAHDIPGGGSSGHDFGHAFWRVRVFPGDTIMGSGRESQNGSCLDAMWLYRPSVTDATLDHATATFQTAVKHSGGTCNTRAFRWTWSVIPFSGMATVWADFRYQNTFEFTAHISHRTVLRLARVPLGLASARATVRLRASVTSLAGTPRGACAFDRRNGARGRWHELRRVGLRAGRCSWRSAAGGTGLVRFRARFVPAPGWLPSAAATPRIRVR